MHLSKKEQLRDVMLTSIHLKHLAIGILTTQIMKYQKQLYFIQMKQALTRYLKEVQYNINKIDYYTLMLTYYIKQI